ncbi:MAG: hypothetical protein KAY37_06835 [Phycisphaerae bacterium]|nr:hypothetical protein [Phycisphaerae bacterium]
MAKAKRRKVVARKKVIKRGRRVKRTAPRRRLAGEDHAVSSLKAYATELIAQRSELEQKIEAVEQALGVMGAAAPRGRAVARPAARRATKRGIKGRPRPGSLKEFIQNVMTGRKVMTVKAITDAVLASGYKTNNKTLAKSVGIALTEMPGVNKIARGKFRRR